MPDTLNQSERLMPRFFQINAGHIITILIMLGGFAYTNGRYEQRIDTLEKFSVEFGNDMKQVDQKQYDSGITESRNSQEIEDIHKNFEDDFSRRLTKLEDRLDKKN